MAEDFLTDGWARNHHRFAVEVDVLLRRIMGAFRILNEIQFGAPWREPTSRGAVSRACCNR